MAKTISIRGYSFLIPEIFRASFLKPSPELKIENDRIIGITSGDKIST